MTADVSERFGRKIAVVETEDGRVEVRNKQSHELAKRFLELAGERHFEVNDHAE